MQAGTGKSRVLCERISHLLSTTPAENILALCFSRKATVSLRSRLSDLTHNPVQVMTINALAYNLVSRYRTSARLALPLQLIDSPAEVPTARTAPHSTQELAAVRFAVRVYLDRLYLAAVCAAVPGLAGTASWDAVYLHLGDAGPAPAPPAPAAHAVPGPGGAYMCARERVFDRHAAVYAHVCARHHVPRARMLEELARFLDREVEAVRDVIAARKVCVRACVCLW